MEKFRREINFEIKFVMQDAIKFAIGHDAIKFDMHDVDEFTLQPF